MISTFEIEAIYMKTDEPDFLDLYQLEDDDYGIQIKSAGGRGRDRKIRITWSPILMYDKDKPGIHYRNINRVVEYKVYLGYGTTGELAQQTLDLFSSLCQLEAQEKYMKRKAKKSEGQLRQHKRGRRRDFSREFDPTNQTFGDLIRMERVLGNNSVVVRGHDINHLQNAVVVAHIRQDGKAPLRLGYSPVSFEDSFDFDRRDSRHKFAYIFACLVLTVAFFAFLIWYFIRWSKAKAQLDLEAEVASKGIAMRSMPTQSNASSSASSF
jgi:hypothetical protein